MILNYSSTVVVQWYMACPHPLPKWGWSPGRSYRLALEADESIGSNQGRPLLHYNRVSDLIEINLIKEPISFYSDDGDFFGTMYSVNLQLSTDTYYRP